MAKMQDMIDHVNVALASDYQKRLAENVAFKMLYDVHPADLEASAQFENLTRKYMEKMHDAIEARLKRLVDDGISIERIRLDQRPDGSTAIVVDNIPNSVFRITYADDTRKA